MTKCWQIELKLPNKTIKTFVYSDTGKDIDNRFKAQYSCKVLDEIDDPISGTFKEKEKESKYV